MDHFIGDVDELAGLPEASHWIGEDKLKSVSVREVADKIASGPSLKMSLIEEFFNERKDKVLSFLGLVEAVRAKSKDPSTQVGAIALDNDYNVLVVGYNGFPRGVADTPERLNDRAKKYPRIVHAEANLVAQAARIGATLKGSMVLLTSLHPCSSCAGLLIQAGVACVYAPKMNENDRWDESGGIAAEMFREAEVPVIFY